MTRKVNFLKSKYGESPSLVYIQKELTGLSPIYPTHVKMAKVEQSRFALLKIEDDDDDDDNAKPINNANKSNNQSANKKNKKKKKKAEQQQENDEV